MRLLKQLVPVAAVAAVGGAGVQAVGGDPYLTLVLGVATAVLAVFVYARVVRWSEHRAPVEVAAQGAARAIARGVLIGVALFAAVIVNIALVGGYRIDGLGSPANGATQGLLHGVTSGPDLLTGGAFGPEASRYAVVFGLLLTVRFMWLARRRGNVVPLRRGATATLAR
ncbi:hypothetical protein [Nonomuraea dietziae]|uniref:hypothetical protein n=1 Tax=Nonomuraea dietziae TaxID=65515 RepID=UPI0033CFC572